MGKETEWDKIPRGTLPEKDEEYPRKLSALQRIMRAYLASLREHYKMGRQPKSLIWWPNEKVALKFYDEQGREKMDELVATVPIRGIVYYHFWNGEWQPIPEESALKHGHLYVFAPVNTEVSYVKDVLVKTTIEEPYEKHLDLLAEPIIESNIKRGRSLRQIKKEIEKIKESNPRLHARLEALCDGAIESWVKGGVERTYQKRHHAMPFMVETLRSRLIINALERLKRRNRHILERDEKNRLEMERELNYLREYYRQRRKTMSLGPHGEITDEACVKTLERIAFIEEKLRMMFNEPIIADFSEKLLTEVAKEILKEELEKEPLRQQLIEEALRKL